MPGGGTQTSSQTSTPWPVAAKHLQGILGDAKSLYNQGAGFSAFPSKTWVPFSDESSDSMRWIEQAARGGNPFYQGAQNFTKGLIKGNFEHDQDPFQRLLRGTRGVEDQYQGLLSSVDPEFENVVQTTANDLGDQIQRQFGGAAYGTPENAGYLTKGVGDVISRMRSDNFARNVGMKQGILGDIMGAKGMQQGILGQMAGLSQQDIANRMAGTGMMDSVYGSQFLPAQYLADVGAAKEGKAGEQLQSQIDKFNIEDMSDWDRLMQYFGVASGTGAQGNRVTTQTPTDPFGRIIGAGILGSQLFGGGGMFG